MSRSGGGARPGLGQATRVTRGASKRPRLGGRRKCGRSGGAARRRGRRVRCSESLPRRRRGHQIRLGRRDDRLAQPGRRLDRLERLGKIRQDAAELVDLRVRLSGRCPGDRRRRSSRPHRAPRERSPARARGRDRRSWPSQARPLLPLDEAAAEPPSPSVFRPPAARAATPARAACGSSPCPAARESDPRSPAGSSRRSRPAR